jgi:hypothetical protein
MDATFAYLADGKLYFKESGKDVRLVESAFVQQMVDRQQQQRERHDWKSQGMAWQFSRGMMPRGEDSPGLRVVRTSAVTTGTDGADLLYAITTRHVGGLFAWSKTDNAERRLLHRNEFSANDLARHPTTHQLAMTMIAEDGSTHLGVMDYNGRGVKQITEGDSFDESPSWVPGTENTLVYQSAGIGRNSAGFISARGSCGILRLDLMSGEMDTLVEDDTFDYLLPRQNAEGTLYYIRRPYQPWGGPPASIWTTLKDFLFFPYRLVMTFVHLFNWLSFVFRRKPLLTASGPPKEQPDARYMMLWGMMIDAEKAMRAKNGGGSLVPQTWKLFKRTADGTETEIAAGVLSYDLSSDGALLYTDGASIWRLADGEPTRVGQGKRIERLIVV